MRRNPKLYIFLRDLHSIGFPNIGLSSVNNNERRQVKGFRFVRTFSTRNINRIDGVKDTRKDVICRVLHRYIPLHGAPDLIKVSGCRSYRVHPRRPGGMFHGNCVRRISLHSNYVLTAVVRSWKSAACFPGVSGPRTVV